MPNGSPPLLVESGLPFEEEALDGEGAAALLLLAPLGDDEGCSPEGIITLNGLGIGVFADGASAAFDGDDIGVATDSFGVSLIGVACCAIEDEIDSEPLF